MELIQAGYPSLGGGVAGMSMGEVDPLLDTRAAEAKGESIKGPKLLDSTVELLGSKWRIAHLKVLAAADRLEGLLPGSRAGGIRAAAEQELRAVAANMTKEKIPAATTVGR